MVEVENYIVRIYRRVDGDPDHVIGMVERAETQEQRPFHSLSALKRLLSDPDTDTSGDGKRRLVRVAAEDRPDIKTRTG